MKPASYLLSMLTIAAASIALCTPSFADAPQSSSLTIDDHQNLVTVKDDSGKWLFAQVISTSNLKVSQVSLGKGLSRISLQDGTGKTLWSKTVGCEVLEAPLLGDWSDKFFTPALLSTINSLPWKDAESSRTIECKRIEFIIGSDDQLVAFRMSGVKHSIEVTPIKNGFVAKLDEGKTLVVLQPPASPAAPTVAQALTFSAPATPN